MSSWFRMYGFAEISDTLVVGAYPLDERDVAILARLDIRHVLNLAGDTEYRDGEHAAVHAALQAIGIDERRAPMVDHGDLPAATLDDAVAQLSAWLDTGERTYVHCRAGWQRSAAVAAATLAVRQGWEIEDALEYVAARKPTADPLPHQRAQLVSWFEARRERLGAAD